MNIEDQFGLEHLLFEQRKCKICGETKELINDFYKTRKDRGNVPSAYAYECKRCSINYYHLVAGNLLQLELQYRDSMLPPKL